MNIVVLYMFNYTQLLAAYSSRWKWQLGFQTVVTCTHVTGTTWRCVASDPRRFYRRLRTKHRVGGERAKVGGKKETSGRASIENQFGNRRTHNRQFDNHISYINILIELVGQFLRLYSLSFASAASCHGKFWNAKEAFIRCLPNMWNTIQDR